jgi:hypothetical protein
MPQALLALLLAANESFRVEGMGPPHALVDAPKDPAAL